jgi:pyruvate/2-oxoglutarate dehydrogenase complex dihydrolipoamide dehydrogenase (E3) component
MNGSKMSMRNLLLLQNKSAKNCQTFIPSYALGFTWSGSHSELIVENENPDAVIIATGAKLFVPNISGVNLPEVVFAQDVLAGKKDVGQSFVVVGDRLVSAETEAHPANHGKKVVIIEMRKEMVKDGEPAVKHFLLKDLQEHNVEIITSATV